MSSTGSALVKPVILLHGAIGAADQLNVLSELLTKKGCACFSFSFSGHGQTDFQSEFGIEQFASELKTFIEKNDLVKPNVFGYSMGGYVALYLASREPDLLGNIVTLGTKFSWDKETSEKEIKMLDPETIEAKVPKFAAALQQRHGDNWKKLLGRTSEMMISLGNKNILSPPDFPAIKNKIRVGIADRDNMVSFEETVAIYKALPDASMFMLPESKHPIEQVNLPLLSLNILDLFQG